MQTEDAIPSTDEVRVHMDQMLYVNAQASEMPYNIAATFNMSAMHRMIDDTLRLLRIANEPYRAVLFLTHCVPLWAMTERHKALLGELTPKVAHCEDWGAFVAGYSNFSNEAPGNGPLKDRGLLNIDRYVLALSRLRAMKPEKVLNVGCGDGTFDDAVLSCCSSIKEWTIADIGDVSKVVAVLRERHPNVKIISHRVEASATDWPTGPFDLVLATEVLEHVFDQESFAAACLTRGTNVLITTPDAAHWFDAGTGDFLHHVRANTAASLMSLFVACEGTPVWVGVSRERHLVGHFTRSSNAK